MMQTESQSGHRALLLFACAAYLVGSVVAGSMRLDQDEFTFVREPYELLGGDYTMGYLAANEPGKALRTAAKSYYLYWNYRPLFSPVISEEHKILFAEEEVRFGYRRPNSPEPNKTKQKAMYQARLIVPEPDRFYSHGAGKPLLAAIANILPLSLVKVSLPPGKNLLDYQFTYNYHPIFILVRLAPILAGFASVLLVYYIARIHLGPKRAARAAALFALFPPVLLFFPNIHHDAYMVPFLLAAAHFFVQRRYLWFGLCFGLALAAKNTAIFLIIPVTLYLIWQGYVVWRAQNHIDWGQGKRTVIGLGKAAAVAIVVLLPFANPVSYAAEILTPLTERAYDKRGEEVSRWFLTDQQPEAVSREGSPKSQRRASIEFSHRLIPHSLGLIFVLLAAFAIWPRLEPGIMTFSFFFLLTMFPYGLVFGDGLGYRSLMFTPFFAILAAAFTTRGTALAVGLLLLTMDLFRLSDPITITDGRELANQDSFVDSYRRLAGDTD